MAFSSPDELDRLLALVVRELGDGGLVEAASRLDGIRTAGWTTSSEWLGEIGLAIREVRAAHAIAPPTDEKLERIMTAVRAAWPNL